MEVAREKLLVVGNGMAGLRFLEELVAVEPSRFAITVVGAEPEPAYNRVLLSSLLAGEVGQAEIAMRLRCWYREHGIALLTGQAVVRLDAELKIAELDDGTVLPFDRCVLALGSQPIRLPLPGADLHGVMTFRTIGDVCSALVHAKHTTPAVVIGGGLLGIEAAYGLARAGVPVTLVHVMDRLMERQLDGEGALLLAQSLKSRGITVELSAQSTRIVGTTIVEAVELADGHTLPCGLVMMAVGVKPTTQLAHAAGIEIGRGIKVSAGLETSVPGIYALGECAEHNGVCYGLVEPAYEQARVLARRLIGEQASYAGSVLATNLKVSGVAVFSAGDHEGAGAETILLRDSVQGTYRKFVVRDGLLTGVVLVGDTTDALWYRSLIATKAPLSELRAALAFGRSFAEAA